ncbi:gas vesicle protein GvpO [Dactylosporangium sp. CA-092794]|uniref:gas vesicle protein GvpO n=1 Tax=Dactylosporangium sp. CA-092794 TaxID=3239929 RepID=UPI003D89FCBF
MGQVAEARTGRRSYPREPLPDDIARDILGRISGLTGKRALGVTSLERADDGWTVEVEVLEDSRIPSSSDMLGLYRTRLDEDGQLLEFHRIRRYSRGKGDVSEVA